jgi:predicted TIM-barrel fold metal-dependent hydrolase
VAVVDSHTHIFAPEQVADRAALAARDAAFAEIYSDPKAKMATAPDLLAVLGEAGIDRAVVAGLAFADAQDIDRQNACILDCARTAEQRFIPLATVNPALPGWERSAKAALDGGARGFGELRPHNQGWDPLDDAGRRLCGLARDAGAVLLWHVSEPVGHAYPGKRGGIAPAKLIEAATAFPGLKMIAAHLGGGLSFYLQMPEVRAAIESLFFDTAAVSLLYDDESVARLVALAGANRVLFGSDYPLLSPRRQLQRITALLPGDSAQAVCGGNADILFSE